MDVLKNSNSLSSSGIALLHLYLYSQSYLLCLSFWLRLKNLLAMQETQVQSLGLGRFPEEENVNPLQYSGLENSTDRGAWWVTVHSVTKSWTRLSDWIELNFHLTSSSHSINSQTSLILSIQCFLHILHFHSFSGHSLYLLSQLLQLQANYLVI